MKNLLMLLLVVAVSRTAAAPDCAPTLERTLQSGGIEALAPLFGPPHARVRGDLSMLARQAGGLSKLERAAGPRFREFIRQSVKAPGLPRDYGYAGLWIDAQSTRLGPVQFHIALEPGDVCQVLAVHLDSAPPAPGAAGRDEPRQ